MEEKTFKIAAKNLKSPLIWLFIFLAIGYWRYVATGGFFFIMIFGYIGLSVAVGLFLSETLHRDYKPWARKITQLLIGLFMLGFLGFIAHENMQIEGFFFYLFAGVFSGATLHYVIAKLVGPLYFGRGWCGWACWTTMILDFLPWKVPARGRIKNLGILRYVHFAVVMIGIIILYRFFDYGPRQHYQAQLTWLIIGNAIYYLLAIMLAAVLKDNRAFCKYICPIPITQKIASRFSVMKQEIKMEECTECELCEENCPMDIKLLDYARNNQRILSTECVLCNTCINICPTEAIDTTKKLDFSWKEHIGFRQSERNKAESGQPVN